MNKDITKEIFLLIFEVFKALCEILWKKIKNLFSLIWDRFFGLSDVSKEQSPYQEWGVTGEDKWPNVPESMPVNQEEPQQKVERKEIECIPKTPDLPDSYGDNRIVLMVRDFEWLFAYWELRKDVIDSAMNILGIMEHHAKIILRVYDVTDIIFDGYNANKYFDIEVTGNAINWYIHVGEPNRSFCVEIGLLTPNSTFCALSRSNTVRMPRIGVSEIIDEKWMCIDELYEKLYVPIGCGISESVFERAHRNWQESLEEYMHSSASSSNLASSKK